MDKNLFKSMSIFFVILLLMHGATAVPVEPFFNKQVANEEIKSVSVSHDGEYIAIAAYESHLIIESGSEITKIYNAVYFFNKSGVKIWDTQIYNGIINDIATNGEYVVVGYSIEKGQSKMMRGYVRLYSKSKGILFDKEIEPLDSSSSNPILYVAISADGITIAASDSHNVHILDKSGSILRRMSADGYVTGIAVSSNLSVVSFGDTVSLYDAIGRMVQSFKVESSPIKDISISDDMHIVVLTQQKIYFYNKNQKLWEKSAKSGSFFTSISLSSDGNWITAGSKNDGLLFLDKNGEEALKNPTSFEEVSTNGGLIAGTRSSSLYLFRTNPYITGYISVISTQGAEVYLDDILVGTVPLTISDVPAGAHTINITKPGYESWAQNINISYGEKKEVSVMLAISPIMPTPTPSITQTVTPSPTLAPISTVTTDSITISKNALFFMLLGIFLIGIPAVIYLKKRNLKLSAASNTGFPEPKIKIDTKNLPFIGGTCPYCGDLIKANSNITVCPDCETPHHQECWKKHGGCTTFGCKSVP